MSILPKLYKDIYGYAKENNGESIKYIELTYEEFHLLNRELSNKNSVYYNPIEQIIVYKDRSFLGVPIRMKKEKKP